MQNGHLSSSPLAGTLTLRLSGPADRDAVYEFHRRAAHRHLDLRRRSVLEASAARGGVLVLEQEGAVCGISASYDLLPDAAGVPRWVEVGSTRLVAGLGLYEFLIATQLVHEFLTRPCRDAYLGAVAASHRSVTQQRLRAAGWRPLVAPPEMLSADRDTIEAPCDGGAPVLWFQLLSSALPGRARSVLEFLERADQGLVAGGRGGEALGVDLSGLPVAGELKPLVERLASGPLAALLEGSPDMGMAEARALLDGPPHAAVSVRGVAAAG